MSHQIFTDKQLQKLSLDELKKIVSQEKKDLKKDYKELQKKRRLIEKYRKLTEFREKVKQGKVKQVKVDTKPPLKKKPKVVKKPHSKRIKTFEDYFEECIKNKKIPKDTPPYLRKALERVINEYEQGIEIEKKLALDEFAKKYIIKGKPGILPLQFFKNKKRVIKDFLRNHRNNKVRFVLVVIMEKEEKILKDNHLTFKIQDKAYFNSSTYNNFNSTDVKDIISKSIIEIIEKISIYQQMGSGWYFKEIDQLEIHTTEFKPINGSSYIPLPDWIMRKKAIVSIRNKDDKCFIWSVLRYLHPREKNDSRLTDLKKYEFSLNTKGITFPMKVKDITKFEKLNPNLPGINVLSNDGKTIYPLREVKKDCKNTIDLFLYEEDGKFHYSLIKNFSRLIRSQITSRTDEPIQICKRCFCHFTKPELLDKHIKYCSSNKSAFVKMPKPNTTLHFENYDRQLPIPFVVYADFECFTKPMNSCSPDPKDSYNYNYQKHETSGFCFYAKGIVNKRIKPIIYTKTSEDEDVAKVFVEKLTELTKGIYEDFYRKPKRLVMNPRTQQDFNNAVNCHICSGKLGKDRVRDHCHFTGKYRGAAHNKCNLMCKKPRILPVIFHNLQGYDAHLFIKQLAKIDGNLRVRFFKKIQIRILESKNGFCVSLIKSENGF